MYLQFTDIRTKCLLLQKCILPVRVFIPLFFILVSEPLAEASLKAVVASFDARGQVTNILQMDDKMFVLGATNHLYVLNQTLDMISETTTGPLPDSPFCNSELTSCVDSRDLIVQTDNWSKVLVEAPLERRTVNDTRLFERQILFCGSIRQGTCEIRSLPTLQKRESLLHVPVAANAPNASTVALTDNVDKLFVASSYTFESPYRDSFPAVSTRLFSNGLFPINSGSLDGEAAVFIRVGFRPQSIRYVSVFSDDRYIYWASVQPEFGHSSSVGNPVTSKLIRVCHNDTRYVSYSEIEIQCRSAEDNTHFSTVQAMVLHNGELVGAFSDSDNQNSAVCIFSMEKIRLTFWYNIDRCKGGTDSIGLPHIGRDAKCLNRSHLLLTYDTCQLGVGGTIEASQVAALLFANRIVTSIDARTIDKKTLIVLGTSDSHLVQLELNEENTRRLRIYADTQIAKNAINRVMFVNEHELIVAIGTEVKLVRLSLCEEETTCDGCLRNADPLCGWCLRNSRCLRQSECLLPLASECPKTEGALKPQNASVSALLSDFVYVPISGLVPPSNGSILYQCVFGGLRTRAEWIQTGIRCFLPEQRPATLSTPGSDFVVVPLLIRTAFSVVPIVTRTFTFYNCSQHLICSSCLTSLWNCSWCLSEKRCTDAGQLQCSKTSNQCAQIDKSRLPELLVPSSTNLSVSLPVINLVAPSNDLFCVFTHLTRSHRVPAFLQNTDRVICSTFYFYIIGVESRQELNIELADGRRTIDKTTITIYKCEQMASDCSQCLALDPKVNCVWCQNTCQFRENSVCKKSYGSEGGQLHVADEFCNHPVIESITPSSGPIEGGTLVEIRGKDLGSNIQDVQDRVRVAGTKCKVIGYEVSVKIFCVTEKITFSELRHGPVRVTIGPSGRRVAESATHFHFKDYRPRSIHPGFGPISGGTKVTIAGDNLSIGRNVSVHFDNLPCFVQKNNLLDEWISCTSFPSPRPYLVTAIRVQIDHSIRILDAKFEYRPDPVVIDIQPKTAFESGGRRIFVLGSHFDSILSAKMFFLSSSFSYLSSQNTSRSSTEFDMVSSLGACKILNSTQMECESPRLELPSAVLRQSSISRWSVGFEMDGVHSVRNLDIQFTTVSNPQFSPFVGVYSQPTDQPLMLEGIFLSQAAEIDDYVVTIGTERCTVFILDSNRLLCRLPEQLPEPTDDSGTPIKDHPLVVVRIGSTIRQEIGPIEFAGSRLSHKLFGSWLVNMNLLRLMLLLFFLLGVLAMSSFLFFCLWHRRSNEKERIYKKIQLQMEQMESNVRNECKQAFVELQTEINSDLVTTIDDSGIPYVDKDKFLDKLLSRSAQNALLFDVSFGTEKMRLPAALVEFDSLLWNKQFIFLFVQTVEEDLAINIAEKSTLSCLLIAALSKDMIYLSEIVLALLSAHIRKSTITKTSHLLFRQSDSVVEKLFQYWFTICLYPYLIDKNGPGRSFFLLYKAIKCQTEKGPVDCITDEARFVLNEQKILRESVDATSITLLIIPIDGFNQAPIVCKALQCDTISQLKSKFLDVLYKNKVNSMRLQPEQFDIEWNCPQRGSVLLLDDDRPQTKGLKKLNTISYYKLPNNALLTMQLRKGSSQNWALNAHLSNLNYAGSGGSSDTNTSNASAWSSAKLIGNSRFSSNPTRSLADVVYYHLTSPDYGSQFRAKKSGFKSKGVEPTEISRTIPEVFLTRLLMCKETLQHFINEFFDSVLFVCPNSQIPLVVKYVMDFLDQEAHNNNIGDRDLLHVWKMNALVLRFWMVLIYNPDCIFDVQRQSSLINSLVVVGQTLMDVFSRFDLSLNKESPSSKLLFAKEISKYRPKAFDMFQKIAEQQPVACEQFHDHISSLSKTASDGMGTIAAVEQLLNWARANGIRLIECLESSELAAEHRLAERLQQIFFWSILEPPVEHVYDTLH